MNKKGNILDWFYILGILFFIGVAFFAAYIVIDKTIGSGIFDEDETASTVANISKSTILNLDNLMLFIIVGLSVFMLVSAAMVFNHPAFFIVSFFLLLIAIIVSAIVSNTFWTFSNASTLIDVSSQFPKMKFIMDNLPLYVAFMGMATALAMFISYNKA